MDMQKMIEDMADYMQKEKRRYIVRRIIYCARSDIHGRLVDVEIEGPFVYGIYEDGQKLNIGEMDFYKHQ